MTYFKRRFRIQPISQLVTLASLAMILSACIRPSQHAPDNDPTRTSEESASFWIDKITALSIQDDGIIPGWGIPTVRAVTFQACAADFRTNEGTKGQKFQIETDDGVVVDRRTAHTNGCIDWTERFAVNQIADAKGIEVRRNIRGTGMYLGFRKMRVALYPWKCPGCTPGNIALDIRDGYAEVIQGQLATGEQARMSLQGLDSKYLRVKSPIWFDDFMFGAAPNSGYGNGGELTMVVQFSPRIMVKNLLGSTDFINLTDGKFRIIADQYSELEDRVTKKVIQRVHIGHGEMMSNTSMQAGVFKGAMTVIVGEQAGIGKSYLIVQAIPIDGPPGVVPFVGQYLLNSGVTVAGLGRPLPVATPFELGDRHLDFAKYVAESEESVEFCKVMPSYARCALAHGSYNRSGLLKNERFRVKSGETWYRPWDVPVKYLAHRTVRYQARICLIIPYENNRDAQSVQFDVLSPEGHPVKCQDDNHNETPCVTDEYGCMKVPDQIEHEFYKPEHRYFREFTFKSDGYTGHTGFYVTPWQQSLPGVWEKDVSPAIRNELQPINTEPSHFEITAFNWNTVTTGFGYLVDRYLNLTVRKPITLGLTATVVRNNTLGGWYQPGASLLPGWYALRVALQKEFYDHEVKNTNRVNAPDGTRGEFITIKKKIVYFNGSAFNSNFEMDIPDLRLMRIRANIMVDIALVDESKLSDAERASKVAISTDNDEVFDSKIAQDVGLEPRSFVGSTIFLNEKDAGIMTATDTLEERVCQVNGCNAEGILHDQELALKIDNVTQLPLGDVVKLRNQTVKGLIPEAKKLDEQRNAIEEEAAQLSRALPIVNLDFVPLTDLAEQNFYRKDGELAHNNVIAGQHSVVSRFINKINEPYMSGRSFTRGSISVEDLQSVIDKGSVSSQLSFRLCLLAAHETHKIITRTVTTEFARAWIHSPYDGFAYTDLYKDSYFDWGHRLLLQAYEDCQTMNEKGERASQATWEIERKVLVSDVRREATNSNQGFLLNFQAGADFGVGHQESEDDSAGVQVSVSASLNLFEMVGGMRGKILAGVITAGDSKKSGRGFSGVGVSLGAGMDWSHKRSYSESHGEKLGFNSSTFIGVDILPLKVHVNAYQRCAAIRMKLSRSSKLLGRFNSIRHDNIDPSAIAAMATRGFILCDGKEMTERLDITERYYYFSQQMNEGMQNDARTTQNNPWMLGLRGRQTFLAFVNQIKGKSYCMGSNQDHVDHGEGPIEQLAKGFREPGTIPTLKGIFSYDEAVNERSQTFAACTDEKLKRSLWWRSLGLWGLIN